MPITYAESLFYTTNKNGTEEFTRNKGNRNEIEGKKIWGNYDIVLPDGGESRTYEPLWWRTFRYVQLDITTQEEPLNLHRF